MSELPTEKNNAEEEAFSNMANLFIELANRLLDAEEENMPEVGTALRLAAARFTAYETTTRLGAYFSANIEGMPAPEEAKTELTAKFVEQFRGMMEANLSEYIESTVQEEQV